MPKLKFLKEEKNNKAKKVTCIICRQPSDNGKFMCLRCAQEIKVREKPKSGIR